MRTLIAALLATLVAGCTAGSPAGDTPGAPGLDVVELSLADAAARMADGSLTSRALTQAYRVILFAAASFTALRLEQLIEHDPRWMGKRAHVTPRELAVLRLLTSDLSIREIGAQIFLSPNTVRTHIRSIYRKLGVGSRADAVARAEALGLLDEAESSG